MERFKNDGKRILISSVIGAAVSIGLSVALMAIMAALVSSGRVGEGAEKAMCVACVLVATAVGALIARVAAHGAALLTGIGTGVIVILAKILLMLLSDESTALDNTDMTLILCILCSGVATGAISPHKRRHRRR